MVRTMITSPGNRWFSWKRMACLVITVAALVIIFRRIDAGAFRSALRAMQLGWFFLAIAVYGVALLFAAWRWHLALRLTGVAVHGSASARLYCIGQYFFVILFGGVAGDVAKSTLYSRWYGHSFPEVFAASPLDRLMGLVGLVLFGGATFAFAAANGGVAEIAGLRLVWPGRWVWLLVLAGLGGGVALMWHPPKGTHPGVRLLQAIRSGLAGLWRTPLLAGKGFACGFIVQVALSGVLALNLRAISHQPLPWAAMLWTFPMISMLGSLPVTVAGLGVREGAAILLLGLYGVPASDAVAASLLSLATTLVWAGAGAMLLWWEERQRQKVAPQTAETISVVIPTWNESKTLAETVRRVRAVPEICEVIVVDGGSSDDTVMLARELGCRVLAAEAGRGVQMRCGAAAATGDVVLLLHADTWLPPGAGQAIRNALRDPLVVGGGFWKVFQRPASLFILGSRWKCAVRFYLGRRLAGDQAIFARRDVLARIGGVPDWPLMEEFELCRRLRGAGRLALADATIMTSARRFAKLGVLRTYARMWHVLARYWLGTSPQVLRRIYEQE